MSLEATQKRLVDWLFKRIVNVLENQIDHIFKKKVLKDGGGSWSGWAYSRNFDDDVDEEVIFLSTAKSRHSNKDKLAKTLVHEVLHIIMPNVQEKYILQLENLLWHLLSVEQKRVIKSYIPKHTVKRKAPKK